MKTSINYICGSVYVEATIQRIALFPVLPNGKKAETKAKCSILTEDGKVFSFFADMQSKFLICSCWRRKMTRSNSITIPPVPAWIILPAKRSKRNPQKNQKYLSKERCFFAVPDSRPFKQVLSSIIPKNFECYNYFTSKIRIFSAGTETSPKITSLIAAACAASSPSDCTTTFALSPSR